MTQSTKNHQDQLLLKQKKAENESSKVEEISFINTIQEEMKRDELQNRLAQLENRIQMGRDRRRRRFTNFFFKSFILSLIMLS